VGKAVWSKTKKIGGHLIIPKADFRTVEAHPPPLTLPFARERVYVGFASAPQKGRWFSVHSQQESSGPFDSKP
jgi:hypothetical protein